MTKVLVILPMRLPSQRVKDKMLKPIGSKPLAIHSVDRVIKALGNMPDVEIAVAVDDGKVAKLFQNKKYASQVKVFMTDPQIPSGTDRVFAGFLEWRKKNPKDAQELKGIINIQGDMPFAGLDGYKQIVNFYLEATAEQLKNFPMSTLSQPWPNDMKLDDLGAVKVIIDQNGRAVYFSRFAIPYTRIPKSKKELHIIPDLHVGVYGFTPESLTRFCNASPCSWEKHEGLEQLRALEMGMPILCLKTEVKKKESFRGMDTPKDFAWAKRFV